MAPVRPASSTPTTAATTNTRRARSRREPLRNKRSARSGRSRSSGCASRPPPATPGWVRTRRARRVAGRARPRRPGRRARAAITFGRWRASGVRSILAAGTGLPQPTAPGQALVIGCPPPPPGRWRPTGSTTSAAAPDGRHHTDAVGRGPRARAAPAQARRHAPGRSRAASHGQDATLDPRGAAPGIGRGRDHRPRRQQHPGAQQTGLLPDDPDHRRVRPRGQQHRAPTWAYLASLEWITAKRT